MKKHIIIIMIMGMVIYGSCQVNEKGGENKKIIPDLINALKDLNHKIRESAAQALAAKGPAAKEAVPALIEALDDNDKQVRSAAAEALGKIGALSAIPYLYAAFEKEAGGFMPENFEGVVVSIADALDPLLKKLNSAPKKAVASLVQALKDENKNVRMWSAYFLGGIGPDAAKAVPDLIELLKDDVEDVRSAAVDALGKIGDRSALPFLGAALTKEKNKYLKKDIKEAINALK